MNDDYLWDSSGKADPAIRELERKLSRFRYQPGSVPEFPPAASGMKIAGVLSPRRLPFWMGAAAAIAVALLGWLALRTPKQPTPQQPAWSVAALEGSPRIGDKAIRESSGPGKLLVGQVIETDGESRASLTLESTGEVQIEPDTRVRLLLGTSPSRQRLELDRGTIQATIWARPGEFAVDVPSAVAVDLGCAYTLQVDDLGAGLLRTTLGWVGFRSDGRDSFIPAGAVCATRRGRGPGTPYYGDAPAALRAALAEFDFDAQNPEERSADLATILKESREQDALTLWHLLSRVSEADRGRVYDRLAALVPPPREVTRSGVTQLDQRMLDLWWTRLGFGDISMWRTWEQSWSGPENGEAAPGK